MDFVIFYYIIAAGYIGAAGIIASIAVLIYGCFNLVRLYAGGHPLPDREPDLDVDVREYITGGGIFKPKNHIITILQQFRDNTIFSISIGITWFISVPFILIMAVIYPMRVRNLKAKQALNELAGREVY